MNLQKKSNFVADTRAIAPSGMVFVGNTHYMKPSEITAFKTDTVRAVRSGHMYEALASMRAFAADRATWEIQNELDSIAQSYAFMLDFIARGAHDPAQAHVYEDLVIRALAVVDSLVRRALIPEHNTLYYSVVRTLSTRHGESLGGIVAAYVAELRRLNNDFATIADPRRTVAAEGMLNDIFNRLWVTHPLTAADWQAFDTLFEADLDALVPMAARAVALGGVTLGALEFYDEQRLLRLFNIYMSDRLATELRLRALTGALTAMFRYKSRPVPKSVRQALATVASNPDWKSDFTAVAIELMRATDTERISNKLRSQMADSMRDIDPELRDKLQNGDFSAESLSEINPEWQERLAHSELADTFAEMHRVQADGGDVFMASFSSMKQLPFFNEPSHWFMPFYTSYSGVAEIDGIEGCMGQVVDEMPILCDSDKYSVMLSMSMIPESNRDMLVESIKAQSNEIMNAVRMGREMRDSDAARHRAGIINHYVQDLYRFFKLFRRKGEFFAVFANVPYLLEVEALGSIFSDEEALETMAQFFFDHKQWHAAAHAYARLDSLAMPEAARSQKLAYATEMDGRLDQAISLYDEAETLDGGSLWTLKRLASALRRAGHRDRAADYYRRVAEAEPDDSTVALTYGYALTEADRLAEAEAQFRKAAYLMPDSVKPLRGLAWVQFRNRRYVEAAETYARYMEHGNDGDWLNYGHALLAAGDTQRAVEAYGKYAFQFVKDIEAAMKADARYLADAGISPDTVMLMVQAVKYGMKN